MSSEVEICNMALQAMGSRSTIASLSEDSNEAINCNILFTPTRDELLQMAQWNFARRTKALGLLKALPGTPENTTSITTTEWSSDWPPPPWLYEYAYPSDCISARYVVGQSLGAVPAGLNASPLAGGRPKRFAIAGDIDASESSIVVILTNTPQAVLIYTGRITQTAVWGASFTQAMVRVLAAKLSMPLAGDKTLMTINYKAANAAILSARMNDGNEGFQVQEIMPSWIAARVATFFVGDGTDDPDPISYPPLYAVA